MWRLFVLVGLVLPGSTLSGQVSLAEGDRVRITALSYGLTGRIGTVRSVSNDRLEFRPADSTKSIEVFYRGIAALDKSVGRKPSLVQGFLYGTAAGLLAGGLWGTGCGRAFGGDGCAGERLVLGGLVGAGAGLVLGLTVLRTDRWLQVALPVGGRPGGLGLSLSF